MQRDIGLLSGLKVPECYKANACHLSEILTQ